MSPSHILLGVLGASIFWFFDRLAYKAVSAFIRRRRTP